MSVTSQSIKKLVACTQYPWLLYVVFKHRVLASLDHLPVLRPSYKTVVDIGANSGQFALAAYVSKAGLIYAFEPLDKPYRKLKSIFKNIPNVYLFNSAIGPESTQKNMYISAKQDSSSLLPITEKQAEFFPGTHTVSRGSVHVDRLNSFICESDIHHPSMLKIDVQGYELGVLNGCSELLEHFDVVYCECSFCELYEGQPLAHEIISFLEKQNFLLAGVFNSTYDHAGQSIQADFLFKRP